MLFNIKTTNQPNQNQIILSKTIKYQYQKTRILIYLENNKKQKPFLEKNKMQVVKKNAAKGKKIQIVVYITFIVHYGHMHYMFNKAG